MRKHCNTERLAIASLLLVVFALGTLAGCASKPYRYGGDYHTACDAALRPNEPQIERGRRAPVLDTVGWVVGIPAKIVMLDHHVSNHNVSPKTEESLQEYLAANGLDRVKVRINEYDPKGEWQRLNANKSVAWPIRYSIGTLSVVGYTLLPGRVFGGDTYNPFTNTINVYSDVPALAVYEGGFAKEYAETEHKGLYAVGYVVPGVGFWQEMQASQDAMRYTQETGSPDEVKAAYRSISPAFAMNAAAPFSTFDGPVMLTALAAGHVSGQVKALRVKEDQPQQLPPTDDLPGFRPDGNATTSLAPPDHPEATAPITPVVADQSTLGPSLLR
jgi:hypothetical protein